MSDNKVGFFSVNGERPVRLSEKTRALAYRAVNGEFGRTMVDGGLNADNIAGIESMEDYEVYACAINIIAQNAPMRHDDDELLLGSANLSAAKRHEIPVHYQGLPVYVSTSHVTCGFDRIIKTGFKGLEQDILKRLEDTGLDSLQVVFLKALLSNLDSFKIWHKRNIEFLRNKIENASDEKKAIFKSILENAANVPENPPTSFREAVQSLWFMFSFLRLCGNWPGIGRLDLMLGEYLKNDLASGKITLDEAREVLAHFWIKGCEWIDYDNWRDSGDAQYYQNIVLGGVDENGVEITNHVTFMVLDIVEELGISEFPIAVRINSNTSPLLLERIAAVQRFGGGIVGVYNEDLIIKSMVDFGYSIPEARCFANDGCWEIQVPGKTCFAYYPLDLLKILQDEVLHIHGNNESAKDFISFDTLYEEFKEKLRIKITEYQDAIDRFALIDTRFLGQKQLAPLISLFIDGCVEKARDYHNRGAKYTVVSPHAGGLPDAANSLLAIKRLVYEDKKVSLQALVNILKANWQGQEALRRYAAQMVEYFGNDSPESNAMTKKVYDDFIAITAEIPLRNGVLRPAGISTFGRQIDWRWERGATADGHFEGEILSGNLSPAPGTDKKGATAIIRSHCLLGLSKLTNGTALDIKLLPDTVRGQKGIKVLATLIKGFVSMGGIFMQTDIIDNAILLEAQKDPEKYQNLAVRVSGWSARFVTLNKEWQDMIITRTSQGE